MILLRLDKTGNKKKAKKKREKRFKNVAEILNVNGSRAGESINNPICIRDDIPGLLMAAHLHTALPDVHNRL